MKKQAKSKNQEKVTYTSVNETGCCPKPNVNDWDETSVTWKGKLFAKDTTMCFFHIPLNMGQMMKRLWSKIQAAKAEVPTKNWILLSYDPSPWKGEHYASVSKEVPGVENVKISGTFLTKVFEGPFKDAPKWMEQMNAYVKKKGKKAKKIYFFYTTCPKCAQHYGKNYVVGLAKV